MPQKLSRHCEQLKFFSFPSISSVAHIQEIQNDCKRQQIAMEIIDEWWIWSVDKRDEGQRFWIPSYPLHVGDECWQIMDRFKVNKARQYHSLNIDAQEQHTRLQADLWA